MYRVLHSTPPLNGGAITEIEPGITSTDAYSKPQFALDGDYASLRAYKRAMLQKYGSAKWQELQEKAEAMQKRLTGIEGRLQQGESDGEKVAGLRLWRRQVAALQPEVLDIITRKARLGEQGYEDLQPQWDMTQQMITGTPARSTRARPSKTKTAVKTPSSSDSQNKRLDKARVDRDRARVQARARALERARERALELERARARAQAQARAQQVPVVVPDTSSTTLVQYEPVLTEPMATETPFVQPTDPGEQPPALMDTVNAYGDIATNIGQMIQRRAVASASSPIEQGRKIFASDSSARIGTELNPHVQHAAYYPHGTPGHMDIQHATYDDPRREGRAAKMQREIERLAREHEENLKDFEDGLTLGPSAIVPFSAVESPVAPRRGARGTTVPQTLGNIRGAEVTPGESEIDFGDGVGTVFQIEDNLDDPSDALQTTTGQLTSVDPLGGYPVQTTSTALVLDDPGDPTDVEDSATSDEDDESPKPPAQLTDGNATDVEGSEEEPEPAPAPPAVEPEPAPAPAPAPSNFSSADQATIDAAAQFAAEQNAALLSGATNDGTGGPANAEDVDAAGNNLVQSVGPSNIPTNRYPGGSQTQFGVQSFGVVPAKASNNAELRQGLVQERRMAQATYTNPKLAPVEDYMFAYQAPIPGYTPYYSGNFI